MSSDHTSEERATTPSLDAVGGDDSRTSPRPVDHDKLKRSSRLTLEDITTVDSGTAHSASPSEPSLSIQRPYSAGGLPDVRKLDIGATISSHSVAHRTRLHPPSPRHSPDGFKGRRKRPAHDLESQGTRPVHHGADATPKAVAEPACDCSEQNHREGSPLRTEVKLQAQPPIHSTSSHKRPRGSTPGTHHHNHHHGEGSKLVDANGMFLQPETHPITEEQLTREVRGIYAGLTMVEKKCIEIDKLQSDSKHDLSHAQWQTLIALHRTLLHEHHDFFLASQHPFASPGLQKLAEKYSMPARMWRYGIHAFLEVLRSRLPHSLEYMLTFIYLAYSMMTLLVESVPAFEGTWIECLGDLARYRMAVEEVDMRDREIWAGVARFWYNKAADKTPGVGRIQHHLAVLARPDVVQQLFYYTKSLTTVQPFPSTRESILLLFDPLLSRPQPVVRQRHYAALTAFVTAHGFLFTRDGSSSQFLSFARQFLDLLDDYIGRSGTTFRLQGAHIVSCNFAAIFEYGSIGALLPGEFNGNKNNEMEEELVPSMEEVYLSATQYWEESQASRLVSEADYPNAVHHNPSSTMLHGSYLAFHTISILLDRVGDKNVFPSVHVSLAFIWCLCLNQGSMKYIECLVPWVSIATFLNSMIRPNVDASKIERVEFPRAETGSLQQMPEDFIIRGQVWSPHYFPPGFFDNALSEDDGRLMETPSLIISRIHRCLWLGVRLSTFQCWMTYDSTQKTFSATPYACALNEMAEEHDPFPSLHSTTTCSITKF